MLYKCFVFTGKDLVAPLNPRQLQVLSDGKRSLLGQRLAPLSLTIIVYPCRHIAPVSATDLPRTKSWDISLDCHIGKYRGVIRSKMFLLEPVTFQFHARMLSLEVVQSLRTFFGPWGRDRCQSPPCWIFLVEQIRPSTASERTPRQVAILPCKAKRQYLLTLQVSRYCLLALQDGIGEPTIEHWTAI